MYLPQLENNPLGRGLLRLIGAYSQKQKLRNGASVLYSGITEAAENTQLQEGEQVLEVCMCMLVSAVQTQAKVYGTVRDCSCGSTHVHTG